MQETIPDKSPSPNPSVPDEDIDIQPPAVSAEPTAAEEIAAELSSIEARHAGEDISTIAPVSHDEPVHVGNFVVAPPQHSSKKLFTVIAVVVSLLLVNFAGMAYWYMGVRIANSEYERVSSMVDTMISDAKNLEAYDEFRKGGGGSSTSGIGLTSVKVADNVLGIDVDKLRNAEKWAKEYQAYYEEFQKSTVVAKDERVKSVYELNKKIIEQYGTSSNEVYGTMNKLVPVVSKCTDEFAEALASLSASKIKTADQFSTVVRGCNDLLNSVESIPSKQINDSFYVQYRSSMQKLITSIQNLLKATTTKEYNDAMKELQSVQKDAEKIDTSKMSTFENSPDSTEQLNRIKKVIDERKTILFR